MVNLYFGDNSYAYPSQWAELSAEQYLALIQLINIMWNGEISMLDMRMLWFKKIAGLENVKVPKRCRAVFMDNIVTASRQFDFFYKLDYGGAIDELSPSSRRLLKKTPADEINSSDSEIRYARTLDYTYIIDAVWAKNLIPEIKVGDAVLQGWKADVKDGILSTTLSAMQFTQGYDLLSLISTAGSPRTIAVLTALLYGVKTDNEQLISQIEKLPDVVLQGVVLNFQAFVSYIFGCTHYSLLWDTKSETSSTKEVIKTSFSDSLYSLCKTGYGNYEQVEQMPLLTYLSIMRSDIISGVKTMAASGSSADDIAEHMHLPVTLILKMI